MNQNHHTLVAECKAQNSSAQLALYRMFYKGVYNTCFRILERQDEAEDAMQESFIKAFDRIDSLADSVSLEAWLKRIAVNTSIDALRKKKLNLQEMNDNIDVEEDEVDNFYEIQLKVEAIKKGIELLPQGFRLVVTLHLLEGFDYEEIAEILKVKESTVRSQYVRGKKRLLELMAKNKENSKWIS